MQRFSVESKNKKLSDIPLLVIEEAENLQERPVVQSNLDEKRRKVFMDIDAILNSAGKFAKGKDKPKMFKGEDLKTFVTELGLSTKGMTVKEHYINAIEREYNLHKDRLKMSRYDDDEPDETSLNEGHEDDDDGFEDFTED